MNTSTKDYLYQLKSKQKEKQRKRKMKSKTRMELLYKSTSAESAVCRALDSLGLRCVRQFPIWTGRKQYYADIYIPSLRLIIEVDGGYHFTDNQKRLDANRSAGIRRLGYHVCRINNRDAYDTCKIRAKISRYFASNTFCDNLYTPKKKTPQSQNKRQN